MLKQFDLVTTSGYWALKGLETPWGGPAIWSLPDVERLVWLRLPGDIVAGAAIAVFLALLWIKLLKAFRG
jgi:nitric oxide reductase large subunit